MYITLRNKATNSRTNYVTRLHVSHDQKITLQAHNWHTDQWFDVCPVSPYSTLADVCFMRRLHVADDTGMVRVSRVARRGRQLSTSTAVVTLSMSDRIAQIL